jgi:hypothetical protein
MWPGLPSSLIPKTCLHPAITTLWNQIHLSNISKYSSHLTKKKNISFPPQRQIS